METILSFAGEMAVKGTVILLLAGGVTLAARGMSAAFRHLVWCGAMVMLLVLPVVVMGMPGWRVFPTWKIQNAKLETRNAGPAIRNSKIETPSVIAAGGSEGVATLPVAEKISAAPVVAVVSRKRVEWGIWGAWAWCAGVAAMLLPVVGGAIYLRAMERRAVMVRGGKWGRLLEQVRKVVGIRRRVVMLESARTKMPMTFGLLRARIVLPGDTAEWGEQKRRMVLLHELTHVKRLDVVTHTLAGVARAMWWFHPLAWAAYRQMGIERERACDDRVIMAGADAAGYAETLVEIAAGLRGGTFLIGGIAMARQSTLETRVRAVLDEGCKRGRVRMMGMVLAGLVVLAVVPLGALRGAEDGKREVATGVVGESGNAGVSGVKLSGGTTVELVGICHDPDKGPWWAADGSPVIPKLEKQSSGAGTYPQFLFHFVGLPADVSRIFYQSDKENLMGTGMGELFPVRTSRPGAVDRSYEMASFIPPRGAVRSWIKIGVGQGEWQTAMEGAPGESGKNENGQYVIGAATTVPGDQGIFVDGSGVPSAQNNSEIVITHNINLSGKDSRLVAVKADGEEVPGIMNVSGMVGNLQSDHASFAGLAANQIKKIRLETRVIEWAEFKDLPLQPGQAEGTVSITGTDVTIKTKNADGSPDTVVKGDKMELTIPAKVQADAKSAGSQEVYDRPAAQRAKEQNEGGATPADGKFYYVMGMVDHGGVYQLATRGISPLQAVAAAGIKSDNQSLQMVHVLRKVDGKQEEVLKKSFAQLLSSGDADVMIQEGDVISVGVDRELRQHEVDALRLKAQEDQVKLMAMLKGSKSASENGTDAVVLDKEITRIEARIDELEKLEAQ